MTSECIDVGYQLRAPRPNLDLRTLRYLDGESVIGLREQLGCCVDCAVPGCFARSPPIPSDLCGL
jgi:hypothetical protein